MKNKLAHAERETLREVKIREKAELKAKKNAENLKKEQEKRYVFGFSFSNAEIYIIFTGKGSRKRSRRSRNVA